MRLGKEILESKVEELKRYNGNLNISKPLDKYILSEMGHKVYEADAHDMYVYLSALDYAYTHKPQPCIYVRKEKPEFNQKEVLRIIAERRDNTGFSPVLFTYYILVDEVKSKLKISGYIKKSFKGKECSGEYPFSNVYVDKAGTLENQGKEMIKAIDRDILNSSINGMLGTYVDKSYVYNVSESIAALHKLPRTRNFWGDIKVYRSETDNDKLNNIMK